jgi:hypothetical protein
MDAMEHCRRNRCRTQSKKRNFAGAQEAQQALPEAFGGTGAAA